MAIYMDHGATTPVDDRVLAIMMPCFQDNYGNASSIHQFGQEAKRAIEFARINVADLISAQPREMLFTSGGTESDNLVVRGVLQARRAQGRHLIVSAVEHHAVLHAAQDLERLGLCELTVLPVDSDGVVDLAALERALRDDTVLVSVMLANNEIGTIEPVADVARIAHARGALVHTDAVQACGQLEVDVARLGVDLLSLSAHKFYGPKGVGALYVRQGLALEAMQVGGAQERGRRGGTENVPGIVGFGEAARLARLELEDRRRHLRRLQEMLIDGLLGRVPDVSLNGPLEGRLPGNVNVSVAGMEAETVLLNLDLMGIAASAGSACTSGSLDPSHVLLAVGCDADVARAAVRFSLGKDNDESDVEAVIEAMKDIVTRVRNLQRQAVMRHG